MRLRRMLLTLALATGITAAGVAVAAAPANAATPTYQVMNTSETPPDGVWFRNSPHTSDTDRVTGHGVYAGDYVRESCFAWGDAVGGYANHLWYYVVNVTRPTVPGTSRSNEGFLNAHYINDGLNADQVANGVPECGSAPPAPDPASVYYSPFADPNYPYASLATTSQGYNQWASASGVKEWLSAHLPQIFKPTCNQSKANLPTTDPLFGRPIKQVDGWSVGRLGVLYSLNRASDAQLAQLSQVIFYDPGSYAELNGSCDKTVGASNILARALRVNPNLRILILAGEVTADYAHPVNGHAHAGIQNVYFPAIRGNAGYAARVLVCNYDLMAHETVYHDFNYLMSQAGTYTTCPGDPYTGEQASVGWHP